MAKFKRGDRVAGWFGTGIVTDVPDNDNVMRIMQKPKHKKPSYRYVLQVGVDKLD